MAKKLDLSGFDEEVSKEPKSSGGIDLSGFDQEVSKPISTVQDEPGLGESLTRKIGQGLTFKLADEGAAAIQAGLDVATSDKELSDLKNLYETYKELQREREKQVEEKYPKISMGAEIAGSIPTAFTPMGAANTVGKAVALGGLYGFGGSEADLTQGEIGQTAQDVATGGALGYGGYKVAPMLGKLFQKTGIPGMFQKAGEGLKTESRDLALKVYGPSAKDIKKERGLSLFSPEGYRKGIGEQAFEELKMTGGPEGARESVRLKLTDLSKQKDELLVNINNQLQQKINSPNISINELNAVREGSLTNTLNNYRNELLSKVKNTDPMGNLISKKTLPSGETVESLGNLDNYIKRIEMNDNDILKLDALRAEIGEKLGNTSFARDPNSPEALNEEILKKVYFTLKDRIEELSGVVNPGLGKMVKNFNMKQSNLLDLGRILFNKEAGEAAKGSGWALGDVMAMGAGTGLGTAALGATVGGPLGMVGALATKKGIEKLTGFDSTQLARIGMSKTLSGAGELAQKTGQALTSPSAIQAGLRPVEDEQIKPEVMSRMAYNASPEELSQAAQKLLNDSRFTHYGKSLMEALETNASEKKNAIIFSILQNPQMRKFLNEQ